MIKKYLEMEGDVICLRHYLLATHGNLSKEFINTIELISGASQNISFFEMTKSKSGETAKKELREIIISNINNEVIVLTDIFGGSVTNICTELLIELKGFDIIAGLNLPMILTMILSDQNLEKEKIIQEGIKAGKEGIMYINELL